jgi:Tetratricopeptide repeat.
MNKKRSGFLLGLILVVVLGVIVLLLPPVWTRVSFYAQQWYTDIKYKISPPEDALFVPGQGTPASTAAANQTVTPTTPATATAGPTALPTATPIPLPPTALLTGIKQESQEWNNCAPTTLSMYLSYWHWVGTQDDIAPSVKPNARDKNVMPYELQDFITNNTSFLSTLRVGGDLQTLKALVADGIPVMVEKGFYVPSTPATPNEGWMGHYELVMGYDDVKQVFYTHDSYLPLIVGTSAADGLPFTYDEQNKSFAIPYADFYADWRAFDYVFLVVYPQEKTNDVMNLLGPLADENNAFQIANERALAETTSLSDAYNQFFAWYNLGSSLVSLQNYTDAATAFDKAFALMPTIDSDHRPYRIIWYETGPYYAYYYAKRYADVINLATTTLNAMSEPILEESYYWRALAENMSGDQTSAIADLKKSLEVHPGFGPSLSVLQQMGVTP